MEKYYIITESIVYFAKRLKAMYILLKVIKIFVYYGR